MTALDGIQSALNPHAHPAAVAAEITWVLIIGSAAIFAIVAAIALYALFGQRENARRLSETVLVVGGGMIFPLIVLSALLVYSLVRAAGIHPPGVDDALRIEVTGEQWWWRVRYRAEDGRLDFETANEIHIPVGQPVEIALASGDVIHSFWVPPLAGKVDMIPGRTNRLRITADTPGQYRGQCAEYCGGPHALMAFVVVADTPERYAEWAERERRPAGETPTALADAQALFQSRCAACHTIRGTPARGALGPDLTHVGSRRTIAAGLLPRNAGTIGGWIASSQQLKPGNLMPSFQHFNGEELRMLATYLDQRK